MYRNIVNICGPETGWVNQIHLFTWDKNGNPIKEVYDHTSYLYLESPKGTQKSVFDTKVERKEFNSVVNKYRWIREHPTEKLYESFSAEKEFLFDMYRGQQETPEFSQYPLRIHYLDIEFAADEEPFLLVKEKVNKPINVLSVYDNFLDEYNVWVLRDKRWCSLSQEFENRDNVKFHVFNSESEMLKNYIVWHQGNYPDVITGWNCEDFDMPYLIERMELFMGESVNFMSPVGVIKKGTRNQRVESGVLELKSYKLRGICILDYLILYKYIFPTKLNNHKLDTVGEHELGYGKLEYEGSIKDFYRRDFVTFVEYNIIDVKLVKELDEKLRYIDLTRNICNIGLCEYDNIFNSSPYITGAVRLQANENNLMMLSKNPENMGLKASYPGGFVFPPKIGNYRHGIALVDFNSLYPNDTIMNNISIETKWGKVIDETDETYTIKIFKTGKVAVYNKEAFRDKVQGKLCISPNKILYINPERKKGIIPQFLERLYASRVSVKDQMKPLYKESDKVQKNIDKLTKAESSDPKVKKAIKKLEAEKKKIDTQIQRLDTIQYSYKIFLNSVYGQMGSVYSPLFDLDNAEAVTLGGQKLNKDSAEFIIKKLGEDFGADPEEVVIYGDTDSLMVNVESVVTKLVGRKREWTDEDIEKIKEYTDNDLITALNKNVLEICKNDFWSPMTNVVFEREVLAKEGTFVAKKKYLMRIRDDEGKIVDKWKVTGIDIKQNALPPKIKDCLKHIIFNSLLEEWSPSTYKKELIKIWGTFLTLPIEEICKYIRYGTERTADGFLNPTKGTTGQAKAAIFYNQVLEKMGLDDKYDRINVGDTIRILHILKSNKYGIPIIGWLNQYPEEFKEFFEPDYEVMFQKTVLGPLKKFIAINNWQNVKPYQQDVFDIDDL